MSPLLTRILSSGVSLHVDGERIRVLGSLTETVRADIRQHKAPLLQELLRTPHYRWHVELPTGSLEVAFSPEVTHGEVVQLYPNARIAPMLESIHTHEAHHE